MAKYETIKDEKLGSFAPMKDFKPKIYALIGHGQMGRLIASTLRKTSKCEILIFHSRSTVAEWRECQRADIFIDFSHSSAVEKSCALACEYKKPLVIGTTGWEHVEKELKKRVIANQIPCLYSPNFSWGIFAMRKALKQIAHFTSLLHISSCVVDETHGENKVDMPSGTAKLLAKDIKDLFGFEHIETSSQRVGNCSGRHSLILRSLDETIELRHAAKSRRCFAQGAIASSRWLIKQQPGWYTMDDMVELIGASREKNTTQKI